MARVNVEQSVFTDARYRVLARELGVDLWSAIGRMTVVWNQCQERGSYVLASEIVNSLFDDTPVLVNALLTCGLARKHRHGLYICGTRGRIEWLTNKRVTARENGRKGGRPKRTNDKPTSNRDRLRSETPPAPAPAPALNATAGAAASDTKMHRATRIPEPFAVSAAMREWAEAECSAVDLDPATADFVDYWRAASGKAAAKADWVATWRNSIRRCQERGMFVRRRSLVPSVRSTAPPMSELQREIIESVGNPSARRYPR